MKLLLQTKAKRTALVILAIAALVSVLAPGALAQSEKTTVTIATYSPLRYDVLVNELLPQWEKEYPHIHIDIQMYPDFWNKLITMMATDAAPDIVDTAGTQLFAHVVRGGAVDLSRYINGDPSFNKDDFFPHVWEETRYPHGTGEGLYAVPYNVVGSIMYYNMDHFDRSGVAYPTADWTWEILRENARKLVDRDADGVTRVWGTGLNATHQIFDALVKAYGGQVLNEGRSEAMLDSPEAAAALEFMVSMIHEDRSAPPPNVAATFASGQTAIHIMGSWDSANFPSQDQMRWGAQIVPAGPVQRNIYGGSNSWEVMRRPGQDLDLVWTVVKELVSPRTMQAFTAVAPRELPARRSALEGWPRTELLDILAESTQWMQDADFSVDWGTWQTAKRNEINPVLMGDRSVQEGLERATHMINVVLEHARAQ